MKSPQPVITKQRALRACSQAGAAGRHAAGHTVARCARHGAGVAEHGMPGTKQDLQSTTSIQYMLCLCNMAIRRGAPCTMWRLFFHGKVCLVLSLRSGLPTRALLAMLHACCILFRKHAGPFSNTESTYLCLTSNSFLPCYAARGAQRGGAGVCACESPF